MNIRIFRQPTKEIQSDGKFYIDTLQLQHVTVLKPNNVTELSEWIDVPIVEATRYQGEYK